MRVALSLPPFGHLADPGALVELGIAGDPATQFAGFVPAARAAREPAPQVGRERRGVGVARRRIRLQRARAGHGRAPEGPPVHHPFPKRGKGYTYEIEEVQRCLRKGRLESALWSHEDSRALHGLLYDIRRMAGIRFPSEG